jgi:hypothetical protein
LRDTSQAPSQGWKRELLSSRPETWLLSMPEPAMDLREF